MATTDQSREQSVVEAVPKQLLIGGEWRDASGGGTLAVEDPVDGRGARRGRRRARPRTPSPRSTPPCAAPGRVGRDRRRASAARSCAARTSSSSSAPTSSRC